MSSPSAAQVTQMRAQRTATLRETCVVTPAVADGGTPVPFTVACTVFVPKGGMDGGGGSSLTRRAKSSVTMEWGTVINTADRFTRNGKTYEIGEVAEETTNSTAVHADCVQVSA